MQATGLRTAAATRPAGSSARSPPPPRRAVVARSSAPESDAAPPPTPAAPSCAKCGVALADAPRGCVEGRIAGGIGAVPGFTWWPIKAYRPCPALEASGRGYTRKGQITDEMLFGKKGKGGPPGAQ